MSIEYEHQDPQHKSNEVKAGVSHIGSGTTYLLTDPVIPPGKRVQRIVTPEGLVKHMLVDLPEPDHRDTP